MPVITVTGLLGSGALEIGRGVADRLNLDFVDRQILVDAAKRLGVSVDAVAERDERPTTVTERLAGLLRNFLEKSAQTGDPLSGVSGLDAILARTYTEAAVEPEEQKQEIADSDYLQTITHVIRELALKDNVVILGRGAQLILKEVPGVLHVLVLASKKTRVERFAQREGMAQDKAEKSIEEIDKGVLGFHRKFWKVDVHDPALYDLTLNLERLPLESAIELVALAAQQKKTAKA
ncbi:MAG TPA: cytidylate kinase-like family protein [Dehalococcoidia bacterium]|nr:cytidylate kinase-like family protein [Dehalococcoidia bacterium]